MSRCWREMEPVAAVMPKLPEGKGTAVPSAALTAPSKHVRGCLHGRHWLFVPVTSLHPQRTLCELRQTLFPTSVTVWRVCE